MAVARAKAELADAQATAQAERSGVPIAQVSTSSEEHTASGGVVQALAAVSGAEGEVQTARAQVTAAAARLREKEATAERTARDVERLRGLVEKDEVAKQQFDAAVSTAAEARAAADAAKSDVAVAQSAVQTAEHRAAQARGAASQAQAALQSTRSAPQQIEATRARAAAADAHAQQAAAMLQQAELNLQRVTIAAPTAGIVSRKSVEVGQVIQAGQPLFALVSLDGVWVTANFKETQLVDIRVGQQVELSVDALGGRTFRGHVESIAPATGAKFSLLPPENATGNFVKVVQRVPVRIALEPGQDPDHRLRPGMSVGPTIFTN